MKEVHNLVLYVLPYNPLEGERPSAVFVSKLTVFHYPKIPLAVQITERLQGHDILQIELCKEVYVVVAAILSTNLTHLMVGL